MLLAGLQRPRKRGPNQALFAAAFFLLATAAGIAYGQPKASLGLTAATSQLSGKSAGVRYGAIQALLPQIPDDLSGDAISQLLGDPKDSWRVGMVKLLAAKARPGLTTPEVLTILGETAAGNRYGALEALIPRIKSDLSGREINQIIGDPQDSWRAPMITLIAPNGRVGLTADETLAILGNTAAGNRYGGIKALLSKITCNLTRSDIDRMAGTPADSWHASMLQVLTGRRTPQAVSMPLISAGQATTQLPTTTAGSTPATVTSPPIKALPQLDLQDMRLAEYAYQFALLSDAVYRLETVQCIDVPTRDGTELWELLGSTNIARGVEGFAWGLKAGAYMNRKKSSDKALWRCAIVFAGSDDLVDWAVNVQQAVGAQPEEYGRAARFAESYLNTVCKEITTIFAGHSLGGGIAQYAYIRTGEKNLIFTFNPAGLAPTNLDFHAANVRAGNVANFVALGYDPQSGLRLGRDVVSLSGVTLGREILIPVYTWAPYTHKIAVISDGLRIQRNYCLQDVRCK
jgi:hypothetical protein